MKLSKLIALSEQPLEKRLATSSLSEIIDFIIVLPRQTQSTITGAYSTSRKKSRAGS